MEPLFTGEELRARGFRAGQGLAALPPGWFERARAERFSSTEEAAHACRVGVKLMWHLECGSVTAPELARRIGRVLGLSRTEVRALTCARTVARRREEARARQEEERALREQRGQEPALREGA